MRAALLCILLATGAYAHSDLMQSNLPTQAGPMPAQLSLEFKAPIRLTSVQIKGDTDITALDLSGLNGFEDQVSLPLEQVRPGSYMLIWRGLGVDGHVMQGAVDFEIAQ